MTSKQQARARRVLLRAMRGGVQAAFARDMGVTPQYLNNVLHGQRPLGVAAYLRIAAAVWPELTDAERLAKLEGRIGR